MTGIIESGLKFRTVYENNAGEKRLIISVNDSVVIWKTADPNLALGAKSQGSATLKSFLRWKTSEHKPCEEEIEAFDTVTRLRAYSKQDRRMLRVYRVRNQIK